jgi:apolipoprotein N-acyltransferase
VMMASFAAFAAGQIYLFQCYGASIPLAPLALWVVVMSVAFALAVLFSGEVLRRDSGWLALLAFPALWTALEYLIGIVSPHGTFGALGYAEVSFPAAIQVAALFGVHAVAFMLCLCANAVALLLRQQLRSGTAGVVVCALALACGFLRLAQPEGSRIRVAALADADTWHAENREHTLASEETATHSYARAIETLSGVRVVAIPEGAVRMQGNDAQAVLAPLADAAKVSGAMVVAGTFVPNPEQNRAFAFLSDGGVETYAKRHLLVPLEAAVPGREPGLLRAGYATQICKDMDFPATVRDTAAHGVRLMIVPANDFGRDGWIHARMAIMRGVENGFALLRSAFNGVETISDARGRILATAPTMRAGMVVIAADVPLGPGPTLYTRIGDVFAWLCAAVSLVLCARAFAGRRTAAPAQGRDDGPTAYRPGTG